MKKEPFVCATTEVAGALLSRATNEETMKLLQQDPKSTLTSLTNIDFMDVDFDVNVVANEGETVNLVLPYYSRLDMGVAEPVTEAELDDVAGGFEFWLAAILATITTIGTVGGVLGFGNGIGACVAGAVVIGAAAAATTGAYATAAGVGGAHGAGTLEATKHK